MASSTSKKPGCLASLFGIRQSPPRPSEADLPPVETDTITFPYHVRDDFLSPAEQSFYHVIKSMMGDHLVICPKVSLWDIFFVSLPHENRGAINRIQQKHVDFVICDPKTMRPLFALELDDSSHQRPNRKQRDAFVDRVFEAAGLPLIHIPVRAAYNTAELGVLFKQALVKSGPPANTDTAAMANPQVESVEKAPFCPKCGTPMVLRTVRQGESAGKQFYGCPNYPKCRGIVPA